MASTAATHRQPSISSSASGGTAAAVALAVDRGAAILRVHDVAMMVDVVRVAAAMRATLSPVDQEHDA